MSQVEPKCPYCGENMELWWKRTGNRSYTGYFDCKNIMCRANGPIVSEYNRLSMEQSAISAALRRPLQKPLTLEELKVSSTVFSLDNFQEFFDSNYAVRKMQNEKDGDCRPFQI